MGTLLDKSQDRGMATYARCRSRRQAVSVEGYLGLEIGVDHLVDCCALVGRGEDFYGEGGGVRMGGLGEMGTFLTQHTFKIGKRVAFCFTSIH